MMREQNAVENATNLILDVDENHRSVRIKCLASFIRGRLEGASPTLLPIHVCDESHHGDRSEIDFCVSVSKLMDVFSLEMETKRPKPRTQVCRPHTPFLAFVRESF
jgi:hypothetical protein